MNFKRRSFFGFLSLMLVLIFVLSACGSKYDENGNPINKNIAPKGDINSASVQDYKAIYKDDDETSVVTMYLTVSKGNRIDKTDHTWAEINSHSTFYYDELGINRYLVEGMLQVGDESGPLTGQFGYGEFAPNSTVEIRGGKSSRSAQKSYKISIKNNEGMWRGQTTIALNKHVYDSVRFRNKLSYDIIKTIPNMFAARTQFVHLYVKDLTTGDRGAKFSDYGLYTQVEQVNKKYLRNHGLDENGHLYKANMFDFARYPEDLKLIGDDTYKFESFEARLETKGSSDHSKLLAVLDEINNPETPIKDIFEKHFDIENYFSWLAFQILSGNVNTVDQNYYLYSPQSGNKWFFIPWDNDGAWKFEENVMFEGVKGYNYQFGITNYWASPLHRRVLELPEYRKKLDDKINELKAFLTKDKISNMISAYSATTKPYIFAMPDIMYAPRKTEEYNKILETIPKEIDNNYEMYQLSTKKPMPFFLAVPKSEGSETVFTWDASFDFSGQSISYNFELADDYYFENPIYREENLQAPTLKYENLAPGQYFYRVTAVNGDGETQTAMEIYSGADDREHFGILCFYVMPDGTIGGQ